MRRRQSDLPGSLSRLDRAFYERPADVVAPDLLGKVLVHVQDAVRLSGRIVETEAYFGNSDPGSHAFRGPTARNRVMFERAGYLYVYMSYGMHACMNVVTDAPGTAGAVLIRALEPMTGIERMERNRGGRTDRELCNGPGKLCQALGITLAENGADLVSSTMWIEDDGYRPAGVRTSTRVGLSAGRDLPWRFYVPGSPYVSRGRPSGDR